MQTYNQTLKSRILTKFDPPLAPPTINHPLSMSLLIKFLLLLPLAPLTPSPFSTTLIATIIGYFNCTQNYSKHILFFYFLDYKGKQKIFSIIIFHWKYFPPDNIFHGKKKRLWEVGRWRMCIERSQWHKVGHGGRATCTCRTYNYWVVMIIYLFILDMIEF